MRTFPVCAAGKMACWVLVIGFLVTVCATLTAHSAAAQSAAADTVSCAADVIVQPGDSLSAIAARTLGDTVDFAAIVRATNAKANVDGSYAVVENPNVINVGWKLCIPANPVNRTLTATAATNTTAPRRAPTSSASSAANNADDALSQLVDEYGLELVEELDLDQIRALSIDAMRQRSYPGSDIVIEQTLSPGVNYHRHIVSYQSDGLKIFALMTIPFGARPASGWPVIVFNHGYIPPEEYRPTERYEAYVDEFARNGYIVFRSDYRGHGDSEGDARGAYGSPAYTVDVLNAVASIRRYTDADPARIGMWGHSLGGYITLRVMVLTDDVRAGVIWSGVVASYADMFTLLDATDVALPDRLRQWRDQLLAEFGTPQENPAFWDGISANSFLTNLSGPIQLHHGTGDAAAPFLFSLLLNQDAQRAGAATELYTYPGDDHNLSNNFWGAIDRSVAFFDAHVKQRP